MYENISTPILDFTLACVLSANSAEPEQTPQNAASDRVLHCLLTQSLIKCGLHRKLLSYNP